MGEADLLKLAAFEGGGCASSGGLASWINQSAIGGISQVRGTGDANRKRLAQRSLEERS
jgi:hypothetical protein